MLKELKYFIFFYNQYFFIFFTIKYYISDQNKKKTLEIFHQIDEKN